MKPIDIASIFALAYVLLCFISWLIWIAFFSFKKKRGVYCSCGELIFPGDQHFCEKVISKIKEPHSPSSYIKRQSIWYVCPFCGGRVFSGMVYTHISSIPVEQMAFNITKIRPCISCRSVEKTVSSNVN
jgi:hypothetical protein